MLGSAVLDKNQAEALRDAILPVLESLFSSLPPDAAQELFMSLSKAYPRPLEWVEAERLCKSSSVYQCSYVGPQPKSESVFPHLADLQNSGKHVKAGTGDDSEELDLRMRKLSSVVSESHVDFLGSLAKLIHAKGDKALLAFQLALLHIQARNCRSNDYDGKKVPSKYEGYGILARISYPVRERLLLKDADYVIAVRYLQRVWRFTLQPSRAIDYVAKLAPESGMCKEGCDFVLSLLDLLSEYADLKVAFGVLTQGTPEQLINGVSRLLTIQDHANNIEHLLLYLESVGTMYNIIRKDATVCQWLLPLQDLAKRIIDLLTSQEDLDHKQKYAYSSLNADLVAQVICDAGSDTVLHVASLLQQRAYSSLFPDQIMTLCAQFYGIPTSSVSKELLLQPPFPGFLVPMYKSKRSAARSVILGNPSDASRVDRSMKEFRSFTKQMGMDVEFTAFAREMADLCPYNVKRMIEKRYI